MVPQAQKLQWGDKNPADSLEYNIDWQLVLQALDGDTIANAVWEAPGLSLGTQAVVNNRTSAVLSRGVAGQSYNVTCTITTAGGRMVRRQVLLPVRVF